MASKNNYNIAVIGLGYVGLPLAVALAKHFTVTGFDIDQKRIAELESGYDRTNEIEAEALKKSSMQFTAKPENLQSKDVYIVTVPTPVSDNNLPDLLPLKKASETIGKALGKNAIVVYESTVYPGVTEDFCGPILEQSSGLKCGIDFYIGYSPERINPGDKKHTIDQITKIVSGQTQEVAEQLKTIYGAINNGNIFVAQNIKTAEAAKVIENAQRDINIAFVNEIATIVGKLGLSVYDVLDAAKTKWNFLNFQPGLVGGHCIGVDPYYLAACARKLEHEPEVILAGRRTNEGMGNYIATTIHQKLQVILGNEKKARILVLGLTFKEDIPDLRNTKVVDLIQNLKALGHTIDVHDPMADPKEAELHYEIKLAKNLQEMGNYDCLLGAVSHLPYLSLTSTDIQNLIRPNGLIADIKNMWRNIPFPSQISYWTL